MGLGLLVRACTPSVTHTLPRSWLLVYPRRCENIYAPGVRDFHPVFPSLSYWFRRPDSCERKKSGRPVERGVEGCSGYEILRGRSTVNGARNPYQNVEKREGDWTTPRDARPMRLRITRLLGIRFFAFSVSLPWTLRDGKRFAALLLRIGMLLTVLHAGRGRITVNGADSCIVREISD